MTIYNAKNERTKKEYFHHLKEADGKSDKTIYARRMALLRFERFTEHADFSSFKQKQAIDYKKYLLERKIAKQTGNPFRPATVLSNLHILKGFFKWLHEKEGRKCRINKMDIEYFNLPANDVRAARGKILRTVPTPEQVRNAIINMPHSTDIEMRNRALIALVFLTGVRDHALISLKIKHIDTMANLLTQSPIDGVRTKFRKTIHTWFFPVGEEIIKIMQEWVCHLVSTRLYGNDDPLFPKTKMRLNQDGEYVAAGLSKDFWQSTNTVRKIFKDAFEAAQLPYFQPHSIRHMLVQLGEKRCKTPEEFKAWSQNLGHEHVNTTFTSYGYVEPHKQGEIIKRLSTQHEEKDMLGEIYNLLNNKNNMSQNNF